MNTEISSLSDIARSVDKLPMPWKTVLLFVAIAKAAVVGASAGLAALGGLDIALAAAAQDWITEVQREYFFDYFALGGGVIGAVWQIARVVLIDR